jgi:hypothetical protein
MGRTDAIEHWGGTSWSVVSSPALSGDGPVHDISASAAANLWAVEGMG